jgi:hypothetical protein
VSDVSDAIGEEGAIAAAGAEGAGVRPIEHRLVEAMRMPSLAVWIVATGFVLAACTAWHNATGAWRGLEVDGAPFWQTSWRLEIVFAAVLGYVFACGEWIARSMRRDFDALAPALALEPSERAAERARIGTFSRSALLAAGVGGALAGIAVHSLVNSILPAGSAALENRSWRFARDVTIWTLAVRLVFVVIGSSQRLSRLSERAARIDLLDLRGLAPLARVGLRSALAFALAASMIAAMADDERTLPVTLVSMALVGAVGAFTVLLPVRGVHRAIRRAKDAELVAIRAAIARTRDAALGGGAEEATRLGGLLALESRIAGVVEWPFDLGTLVRFGAFLALPLGSWIAAALVERLVSRALG